MSSLPPFGDGVASGYCRTCRRALYRTTRAGIEALLHSAELRGEQADHRPDPVRPSHQPDPVVACDFCPRTGAAFVYRCADQDTPAASN